MAQSSRSSFKDGGQRSNRFASLKEELEVQVYSWGDVDMEGIRLLLFAATINGAAVMFSTANEGEAVCVTLFQGGDKVKRVAGSASKLALIVDRYVAALGVDPMIVADALKVTNLVTSLPAD